MIQKSFAAFIIFFHISFAAIASEENLPHIDADFPGGNIVVDRIEENDVYIHQDLRDTQGDWFYWYFRVSKAEGRTLTFHFTQSNVIGVRGPAFSLDGGNAWNWLGKESVQGKSFIFSVPNDVSEVRFCFTIPYLESNLNAFLSKYKNNPFIQIETLCKSRQGRTVERIRLGAIKNPGKYRILLTCRHHSCETMASFVLEGVMEEILGVTPEGRWLRKNVEFAIVPFVDKDGVENGDQGKNRKPRDHNRDYENSIYPEVKAIKKFVSNWSQGRLRVAVDMHCPYIRGDMNELIYFVYGADEERNERIERFAKHIESQTVRRNAYQPDCLIYRAKNNLGWNQKWNTPNNYKQGKSSARWTREIPGIDFGTSIEIPYANAEGKTVTAESARKFGRDMAKAIHKYLTWASPTTQYFKE